MRHSRLLLLFVLCLLTPAFGRAANFVSPAEAPNATPGLLRELNSGAEEVRVIVGLKDGTPTAKMLLANPDPDGEPERRVTRMAAQQRLAEAMTPQQLQVRHLLREFFDARRHRHAGGRGHAGEPAGCRLGRSGQGRPILSRRRRRAHRS